MQPAYAKARASHTAPLSSRYEALFHVCDSLRGHRHIPDLFRALPLQLQNVLEFDYLSVLLKAGAVGDTCWFVLEYNGEFVLTPARAVPGEQAHVLKAFEQQQATTVSSLHSASRF